MLYLALLSPSGGLETNGASDGLLHPRLKLDRTPRTNHRISSIVPYIKMFQMGNHFCIFKRLFDYWREHVGVYHEGQRLSVDHEGQRWSKRPRRSSAKADSRFSSPLPGVQKIHERQGKSIAPTGIPCLPTTTGKGRLSSTVDEPRGFRPMNHATPPPFTNGTAGPSEARLCVPLYPSPAATSRYPPSQGSGPTRAAHVR